MAKQSNIFTSEGRVGKASFYKHTKRGYLLRQKGGVSAARIATDPKFENTRKNGYEFGRAGVANRVLRESFANMLKNGSDGSLTQRLTRDFMTIVQNDPVRAFGERLVLDQNLPFLEGFDFNADAPFITNMSAQFTATIDRATGHCTLAIPSFLPQATITEPSSATHYKIVIGSAEIDFPNEALVSGNQQASAMLPIDNNPTAALNLQVNVTPNSTLPLFMVVGIQYFFLVNNMPNAVNKGKSNALKLVKVSV